MILEIEKINKITAGRMIKGQVCIEIDIETLHSNDERMFYDLWEYLGDEVVEKLLNAEGWNVIKD